MKEERKDWNFEVVGLFDGKESKFHYIKKDGKVTYTCEDKGIIWLFEDSLGKDEPIGPVGQYMKRDVNNPLVVLFILKQEVFDEIIDTIGEIPMADETPKGSIC